MKTLVITTILLFAAVASFGQTFGEGSVVFVLPLPGPGSFRAFDFNLCCGAPGFTGYLGNGFDYDGEAGGSFNLTYKAPGACAVGCKYSGTFVTWNPEKEIDQLMLRSRK